MGYKAHKLRKLLGGEVDRVNFLQHRVSERQMLSEMMQYCNKIITYRLSKDDRYKWIQATISTRTNGTEITGKKHELILSIRYDERCDHYYFYDKIIVGATELEQRIIIYDKEDFYSYFNFKTDEYCNEKFKDNER